MTLRSTVRAAAAGSAALALAWGAPPPALSQAADLARATCGQLLDLPQRDQGQVILWLHGYYAGAAQRALLDKDRVDAAVRDLLATCGRERGLTLIGPQVRAILLGDPAPRPPGSEPGIVSVPPAAAPSPPRP